MALHLVRHGQTEANKSGLLLGRANPGLDDVGRRQAIAMAAVLPPQATIVSSPLDRCRQTAHGIKETNGGNGLRTDDRLVELDYGDLDLTPMREVPGSTWLAWQADTGFRPPNGETLEELADRVGACLDQWWPEAVSGEVIIVTHVSPIKAAVAWALGASIAISWRCFVAQASITTIGSGSIGPSLHRFNQIGHLDALG